MKTLIFATNNQHKLQEIRQMLQGIVDIKSLQDVHLQGEIPETADTLEGNALQKAQWVRERTGQDCFADDTGLEVEALGGAPGVRTARYAGEGCSYQDNVQKMLREMQHQQNRKARFRTVIALLQGTEQHLFQGHVDGTILEAPCGQGGFGYDPIFMPDRFAVSFAEMPPEVKNSISHRGMAVRLLVEYLKKQSI